MRKTLATILLVLGSAVPILAHHPFASEYDWKKPATLTGTLSKVEWMAPHARLTIDGKLDPKDQYNPAATWTVELAGPQELTQLGWKLGDLKVGSRLNVDGWLGYVDGAHAMNARSIHLADGRELIAGSSFCDMEPTSNVASATKSGSKTSKARIASSLK